MCFVAELIGSGDGLEVKGGERKRVKDDSTSSTWKDGGCPPLRRERPWEEQAWREIGLGLGSAEFDALSFICMENWELHIYGRSSEEWSGEFWVLR